MKDAQITLRGEECALSMEQRRNFAAAMVALTKSSKEVYVGDMGQISLPKHAVMKGAPTMPSKEESVSSM